MTVSELLYSTKPPSSYSSPMIDPVQPLSLKTMVHIASFLKEPEDKLAFSLANRSLAIPILKQMYSSLVFRSSWQFLQCLKTLLNLNTKFPYSSYIKQLDIASFIAETVDIGDVDILIQLCSKMTHFRLCHSFSATNIVIQSLSDNAYHLKHLCIRHCPITDYCIPDLVKNCSKLFTVDLSFTRLTTESLFVLVSGCSNLMHLCLDGCQLAPGVLDKNRKIMFGRSLQHLSLRESSIDDSTFQFLISACSSLEILNLAGCEKLTDQSIVYLTFMNQKLRKLNFSYCHQLTDVSLLALGVHGNPLLESLNISGCYRMTAAGLCHLKCLEYLQNIHVNDMPHIQSEQLSKIVNISEEDRYMSHSRADTGTQTLVDPSDPWNASFVNSRLDKVIAACSNEAKAYEETDFYQKIRLKAMESIQTPSKIPSLRSIPSIITTPVLNTTSYLQTMQMTPTRIPSLHPQRTSSLESKNTPNKPRPFMKINQRNDSIPKIPFIQPRSSSTSPQSTPILKPSFLPSMKKH